MSRPTEDQLNQEQNVLFEKLVAGELSPEVTERLIRGQEGPELERLTELHFDLVELREAQTAVVLPPASQFRAMREAVIPGVEGEARKDSPRPGPPRQLRSRAGASWLPRLAAAAGIALAVGFGLGRFVAPGTPSPSAEEATAQNPGALSGAAGGAGLGDTVLARFSADAEEVRKESIEDLRVSRLETGEVEMSFDLRRSYRVVRPATDPMVLETLLASFASPDALGARLEAIELVGSTVDPRVEAALIEALHGDPEVAVRLRALEGLERQASSPAVRDAFLAVIEGDASVQMRLRAIDALSREPDDASRQALEELLEAHAERLPPAVRQRAQERLL